MASLMIFALVTSLLTGVTQHIPGRTLFTAGITGTIGWSVNQLLIRFSESTIMSATCGAVAVGILAEIFARLQKEPTTIFIITGIVPLAPGLKAYSAMQELLNGQFNNGIALGLETALISAYIAGGLAVVSIMGRAYSRIFDNK